jgi:hypothetical protein
MVHHQVDLLFPCLYGMVESPSGFHHCRGLHHHPELWKNAVGLRFLVMKLGELLDSSKYMSSDYGGHDKIYGAGVSMEILLRPKSRTKDYISSVVTKEEGRGRVVDKLIMYNIGKVEVEDRLQLM